MSDKKGNAGSSGIGLGCVLALVLSWSANHSVGYAILHGILSWFYVLYYVFAK